MLRDRAKREREKGKKGRETEGEKALKRQLDGKGKEKGEEDDVKATIIRPDKRPSRNDEDDDNEAGPSSHRPAPPSDDPMTTNGHLNFWAQLESQPASSSSTAQNASFLRDQKLASDKWEDQITMYLGKPAKELRPWYSDKDLRSGEERKRTEEQRLELAYKDGESKRLTDPLAAMNGFLRQRDVALSLASSDSTSQHPDLARSVDGKKVRRPDPDSFRPSVLSQRRKRRQASRSPTPPEKRRKPSDPQPTSTADEAPADEDDYAPALPPSLALVSRPSASSSMPPPANPAPKAMKVDLSSERRRAQALMDSEAEKRRRLISSSAAATPRTDIDGESSYGDAYNRDAVREAKEARRRHHQPRYDHRDQARWRGDVDEERWRKDRERERERYWDEERRYR